MEILNLEVRIKVIYVIKNKKIMENFEIIKIENLERVVISKIEKTKKARI